MILGVTVAGFLILKDCLFSEHNPTNFIIMYTGSRYNSKVLMGETKGIGVKEWQMV